MSYVTRLAAGFALAMSLGCARGAGTSADGGDGVGGAAQGAAAQGGSAQGGAAQGGAAPGGGGGSSECSPDCASIVTAACQIGVCNEATGQCEIVDAADRADCDDGLFCTTGDRCEAGACRGGPPNACGLTPVGCQQISCDEAARDCSAIPVGEGMPCTPADLCAEGATCQTGACIGTPRDCFFEPVPDECHVSACNAQNGLCEPVVGNEGVSCSDGCTAGGSCSGGVCVGGSPMDCSSFSDECHTGTCDPNTSACVAQPVAGPCSSADDDCNAGACIAGSCVPQPANEGALCTSDPCVTGQVCTGGTCSAGTPVTQCIHADLCCPAGCALSDDDDCGCIVPTQYPSVENAVAAACSKVIVQAGAPTAFNLINPPQSVTVVAGFGAPTLQFAGVDIDDAPGPSREIVIDGFTLWALPPQWTKAACSNTDPAAAVVFANLVVDNQQTAWGVIDAFVCHNFTLRDSVISNNVEHVNGVNAAAGLRLLSSPNFTVLRNVFSGNSSDGIADAAGAVMLEGSTTTGLIANNLFVDNVQIGSLTDGAAAIHADFSVSNVIIRNNTFAGNTNSADASATMLHCDGSFSGSVLMNNISHDPAGNQISGCSAATISYSNHNGALPAGTGNISQNPMFDAGYGLLPGSPSIDAGDPAATYNDSDSTTNDQGWTGGPTAP